MGRHRKNGNPLGLERRVYWHRSQWQYRHPSGDWEPLGTDVRVANERARRYNNPGSYGTVAYWMAVYLHEAEAGTLPAGRRKAARTVADNRIEAQHLADVFGAMYPAQVTPALLSEYRDRRVGPDGRGRTRANRELSLASAFYAWLLERGHDPAVTGNPAKAVRRYAEAPKERYVEDAEFRAVYAIAQRSVAAAMDLVYRTLQRPADVLALTSSNMRTKTVAGAERRVLTVTQGKTGRTVDIEITADLDAAMQALKGGDVVRLSRYLVHDLSGEPYTIGGIGAMLRRYCKLAGVQSFGLMDLRAKGATDLYLAGVPLESIQALMGHASVTTTEIYIKRLLATVRVAAPNARAIRA